MEFFPLVIGIVFVVVAIAVFKIHAFLALILAGFLVGALSPVPLDLSNDIRVAQQELEQRFRKGELDEAEFRKAWRQVPGELRQRAEISGLPGSQAVAALEATTQDFGSTAASIGVVIALAAIIGQCLMESGAADKITRKFLQLLGEKRAPLALLVSGYIISVPVFFDTVFFLLIPLARALRLRTGKSYVTYVMAIAAGAVITHTLVPPTPGPLIMVDNLAHLNLNLGTAIAVGMLLGIVPAMVALKWASWLNDRLRVPFREALGSSEAELEKIIQRSDQEIPGFLVSIVPVVLPVVLISGNTLMHVLNDGGNWVLPDWVVGWSAFLGNKNFALTLAAVWAMGLLAFHCRYSLAQLRDKLEPAIMSAGVIILITSAGGAFGKMLARCGVGEALQGATGSSELTGIGLLLLGWGISAVMKVAQGSGTVAMITASAMLGSLLGSGSELPFHPVYLFAVVGFGSLAFSWMNDSGFWVICKMSGFTERETFLTWTPTISLLSLIGLVEVVFLSWLFPLK